MPKVGNMRQRKARQKQRQDDETQNLIKNHRKQAPKHVVTFEIDATPDVISELLRINRTIAYIGRRVSATARKRLNNLHRRNDYHNLQEEYSSIKKQLETQPDNPKLEHQRKSVGETMNAIQEQEGLTKSLIEQVGKPYAKKEGVSAVLVQSRCDDIWKGIQNVLYDSGRTIHSSYDYYALPIMRAKQYNKDFVLYHKNGQLWISFLPHGKGKGNALSKTEQKTLGNRKTPKRIHVRLKVPDDDIWLTDERQHIIEFLRNPQIEQAYVQAFKETGQPQDTFRPCYVAVKMEHIRGKWRAYAQITVEGRPLPKRRKDGSPRHKLGSGRMGIDLGPSSYAASADGFFEMRSLAERDGRSSYASEARQRRLQRKMDRSRRATNPEHYNEDGTIKKGRKRWRRSKSYERVQAAYHDLCRTNRVNREYAVREDVNRLREHASEIVSEQQSIESWKRRAKESSHYVDSRGRVRMTSRKRMGRSVQNRCPGLFRELLRQRFSSYREVHRMFRASQYDHMSDSYVKKPLGQRTHVFPDGRGSPRDGYSSFLLWCCDDGYQQADRSLCLERFDDWFVMVDGFVRKCQSD